MPTYEYVCGSCEHQFEEFQSITAAALENCPKCKGAVRRLISAGNGLIFKGSGFYITDYKNTKANPDSKTAPKTKGTAESKGTDSSKPAKAEGTSTKSE